jgi:pimeloyl-ACP methyl ester carboxylesterase
MRIVAVLTFLAAAASYADDGERLLSVDHYVRVRSTVPAIAGQTTQIYVREVVRAGTPAEVAFDVPYQDYSWMGYLARAGFDVFSIDMTGHGRSTRPAAMNDPCNLSREQQMTFVSMGAASLISAPCAATYGQQMTTLASDWNDIGSVVDHLLVLRHVDRVGMVAWSLGGPRAAGYAAQHPEKVRKLVLLAPAYNRDAAAQPPAQVPANGAAMTTQSHDELTANWDRQVGCPDQYDPEVSQAVWTSMLDSDPVGATWGAGVRRAPQVTSWGWDGAVVAKMKTPMMITGAHDKQVPPERVRNLYQDIGSSEKVLVDLACSSHNAMWEKDHVLLFRASVEWLTKGTVDGSEQGTLKLGY